MILVRLIIRVDEFHDHLSKTQIIDAPLNLLVFCRVEKLGVGDLIRNVLMLLLRNEQGLLLCQFVRLLVVIFEIVAIGKERQILLRAQLLGQIGFACLLLLLIG
jgi:hypothetical protein